MLHGDLRVDIRPILCSNVTTLHAPRCPVMPSQIGDLNRGLRDLEVKSRVAEAIARRW